jgi:hypothetical protein
MSASDDTRTQATGDAPSERQLQLAAWVEKIHEQVARIGALLAKDVVVHIRRAAREAFTRDDRADAIDETGLAHLKDQVEALAVQLAPWVTGQIGTHDWMTESALTPEGELSAVAHIQQIQASVDAELSRVLHDGGLSDPGPWALPRRFIDGDDLVSLTRGLFKAVAHHRRLDAEVQRTVKHQSTAERARRWDDA